MARQTSLDESVRKLAEKENARRLEQIGKLSADLQSKDAALVKAHVASEQPALPITTGIAVVWTGEVDAVPAGWALCGSGGQPPNPSTLSSGYWIVKITI